VAKAVSDLRALWLQCDALTNENLNVKAMLQEKDIHLAFLEQKLHELQSMSIPSSPSRRLDSGKPDYHAQFLRAESYRKALVFQKKYLLMLLGRFQESEEHTLAFVLKLSGQPPTYDARHRQKSPWRRARCLVLAVVFMRRLARLSLRWHTGGFAWQKAAPATSPLRAREGSAPLSLSSGRRF
jgi:hypothetical protein